MVGLVGPQSFLGRGSGERGGGWRGGGLGGGAGHGFGFDDRGGVGELFGGGDGDLLRFWGALPFHLGDRRVDGDAFGAFLDQDLAEDAFLDGFDFHRGLVGLDFGDDVTGADFVAGFFQPFGEFALGHGRREGWHEDLDGH